MQKQIAITQENLHMVIMMPSHPTNLQTEYSSLVSEHDKSSWSTWNKEEVLGNVMVLIKMQRFSHVLLYLQNTSNQRWVFYISQERTIHMKIENRSTWMP